VTEQDEHIEQEQKGEDQQYRGHWSLLRVIRRLGCQPGAGSCQATVSPMRAAKPVVEWSTGALSSVATNSYVKYTLICDVMY
jgi:hypothetical protein